MAVAYLKLHTIKVQTKLKILQLIQSHPDITQRDLELQSGVRMVHFNYIMEALREKGFVKIENFSKNPNKFQYANLPTPL